MPSQHVGQPGPEQVGLEQRALLGVWRQPGVCELLLDAAHGRGQAVATVAVAAVAAEKATALGGTEPVVGVLGDPQLVPRQARRTPCPGAVGRHLRSDPALAGPGSLAAWRPASWSARTAPDPGVARPGVARPAVARAIRPHVVCSARR